MPVFLADTSALFAAADRTDQNHLRARPLFQGPGNRFHLTNAVLWEFFTLARSHLDYPAARLVTDAILRADGFTVHYLSPELDAEVWEVLRQFRGIHLSHVDASLIALGQRLGIREVFSFDTDFANAGMTLVPGG